MSVLLPESYPVLTNQGLQPVRKDGVAGKLVASVHDSELTLILERCGIVAELVQKDTQSPDVGLFVDRLFPIHIDHFGTSILQCCVALHVLIHQAALYDSLGRGFRLCGRAEVAKLKLLA